MCPELLASYVLRARSCYQSPKLTRSRTRGRIAANGIMMAGGTSTAAIATHPVTGKRTTTTTTTVIIITAVGWSYTPGMATIGPGFATKRLAISSGAVV